MHTSPEKVAQVIALIENGLKQRAVARQLHMTRGAVRRVCERYEETRSFRRRPGTGRKRYTTDSDDRFIMSTMLRNRRLNAIQLQQQLRETRGVTISQWTVRRRLKESNMTPQNARNLSKTYPSSSSSTPAFCTGTSELDTRTMGICFTLR
ncbi:uncharacterized protein LOC115890790 [Sitophilus oryzae]|uniref:Uncharacterized protein LOC115890790 n=1 Tax=Sitophilus oryzae TaxID=7048 RepID=A0A6J2YUL4_SITOR|nr:uncharacterized protein LOC115890790 [Sitophilus oryzae]